MNGIRQSGKLSSLEKRKWRHTWLSGPRELRANSGLQPDKFIEVGDDHRLVDPEALETMLTTCERSASESTTKVVTIMIEQDVTQAIDLVSRSFPMVAEAMRIRLGESCPYTEEKAPFSFAVSSTELTPQLYDAFRPTAYFLLAVPDSFLGQGQIRASIRKKRFVEPSPSVCFHATPLANQGSVELKGLLPGFRLGKVGRSPTFADSPYYIFASLTAQDARDWCERFEEDEYLIYPVNAGESGIRLFDDPCSVGESGTVVGYILDAAHVAPELLGSPCVVGD